MSERMQILEMIEAGEIGAEEGVRRLEALAEPAPPPRPPAWVRRIWQVVFWSGVVLTAGGGLLLTSFYAWEAGLGSAICGWSLLAFGVLGLLVGVWLQRAHWFSVRVWEKGSRRVAFALPLPLVPLAWLVRLIRPYIPDLRDTAVDEVILALRDELRNGHPFVVDVNEGGGEQVQVYFG